jgi:hypothetical protein
MTRTCLTLGVLVLTGGWQAAVAAEAETRTFQIRIDGKPAGEYRMAIREEGGTTTVTGEADVRVRYLIYTYTYSYRGTETWKDGRLQRLDSRANDDGKPFQVSAAVEGDRLRVNANGFERRVRPDVWTTTYWRLAAAKFRNQAVTLLDADTGREINAVLQYVGDQALPPPGRCRPVPITASPAASKWSCGTTLRSGSSARSPSRTGTA